MSNELGNLPIVRKQTCNDNRSMCPICRNKGFVKGELVMFYLHDSYHNRHTFRTVHIVCAMRAWSSMPFKKVFSEAQRLNLLEAV